MPRIISGSSVGSVIAYYVCTARYDHLKYRINVESIDQEPMIKKFGANEAERIRLLFQGGPILDMDFIKNFLRRRVPGDFTFKEIYDNFGWNMNITVTDWNRPSEARLLNYLTSPTVVVWSAVAASCSVPYLFAPQELYIKNDRGTLEPYMPGG